MEYLTIAQLKELSVIPEIINCEDNKRLQFLLDYSSCIINAYTDTDFDKEEHITKTLDGEGDNNLPLPKRMYNLIQVKDVINNVVYPGNVVLKSSKMDLYCRDDVFDDDIDNIEVTGDWGWESVPEEIITVLVALCNRNFENLLDNDLLKRITGPLQSETIGDYSYALRGNLSNGSDSSIIKTTGDIYLDMILDKYRKSEFYIGVI